MRIGEAMKYPNDPKPKHKQQATAKTNFKLSPIIVINRRKISTHKKHI
jgi:hypothetical protein